jgi:uncharacterized protein YkwD
MTNLLFLLIFFPFFQFTSLEALEPPQNAPKVYNLALHTTGDRLVDLANQERAKSGCKIPLRIDKDLMTAAQERAEYVANGHWTHDGNWAMISKYYKNYSILGEDMARYFLTNEEVITAWLNSKTHKEVLLTCKYRDAGVGRFNTYTIMLFGKR